MIFWRLPVAITVAIIFIPSASVADTVEFEPYLAEYKVRFGAVTGKSTMTLRKEEDGSYSFHTYTRPNWFVRIFARGSIEETSRFTIEDGRIRSLWFKRVDSISDDERDMELEFDWTNGMVRRSYDGREEEFDIPDDGLDPALWSIAAMLDRKNGRAPGPYTLVDHNQIIRIEIVNEGSDTVKSRAGEFLTTIYSYYMEEEDRTTKMWVPHQENFAAARIAQYDNRKKRFSFEVSKLSFDSGVE